MKRNAISASLVCAAVIGVGSASYAAGAMDQKFTDMDANGDGSISQEEATSYPDLYNQFRGLDKNANGKLDDAEFSRFEKTPDDAPNAMPSDKDATGQMEGPGVETDDDDETGTNSPGGFGRTNE